MRIMKNSVIASDLAFVYRNGDDSKRRARYVTH